MSVLKYYTLHPPVSGKCQDSTAKTKKITQHYSWQNMPNILLFPTKKTHKKKIRPRPPPVSPSHWVTAFKGSLTASPFKGPTAAEKAGVTAGSEGSQAGPRSVGLKGVGGVEGLDVEEDFFKCRYFKKKYGVLKKVFPCFVGESWLKSWVIFKKLKVVQTWKGQATMFWPIMFWINNYCFPPGWMFALGQKPFLKK